MKQFIKQHAHSIVTTITVIVLLGFSYQVMAYLFSLRELPAKQPPKVPVRAVLCETVDYGTVKSSVVADGRVISTQEVVVSTEVRGEILEGKVPLKKGQNFRKGDVLIRVFDGNADMSLRSRKSGFLQKIAGILPDMKVDYPESYDTWMTFFQAITIDGDLPELPAPTTSQEKVFLASRSILTDYYSIKSDEITLSKHVIRAPFDGAFTDVSMEVGAIANPGATLARIIRTDSLELEVPVESDDARWIKIGDKVEVSSGNGSTTWTDTVVRKASFVDTETQSISVFVRLNDNGGLRAVKGQYLRAVFPGGVIENAMEMPRSAVFNHNEVFVVENGKLTKRELDIVKVNETTIVFSDIEPGIELVVEPLISTMENMSVEIKR